MVTERNEFKKDFKAFTSGWSQTLSTIEKIKHPGERGSSDFQIYLLKFKCPVFNKKWQCIQRYGPLKKTNEQKSSLRKQTANLLDRRRKRGSEFHIQQNSSSKEGQFAPTRTALRRSLKEFPPFELEGCLLDSHSMLWVEIKISSKCKHMACYKKLALL